MNYCVSEKQVRKPPNGLSDKVELVCLRFASISSLRVMETIHYLQACSVLPSFIFFLMILLALFYFEGEFLSKEGRGGMALSNFTFCLTSVNDMHPIICLHSSFVLCSNTSSGTSCEVCSD